MLLGWWIFIQEITLNVAVQWAKLGFFFVHWMHFSFIYWTRNILIDSIIFIAKPVQYNKKSPKWSLFMLTIIPFTGCCIFSDLLAPSDSFVNNYAQCAPLLFLCNFENGLPPVQSVCCSGHGNILFGFNWAALREKFPNALSRCHSKRRMDG